MTDWNWTIAYRKRTANHFKRVAELEVDWDVAYALSDKVVKAHPELQVWVTTTAAAERSGYTCAEDAGNILTDTGRRVRVFDTGSLAELGL